jgi:cytochrome c oxidase subunit III
VSAHADNAGVHAPPTNHPYKTGLPATVVGLIFFLGSELALFGAFFMYYGYERLAFGLTWPPPGFELPAASTSINTLLLILSSFTCELALISLLRGRRGGLTGWLVATWILGAGFLGLQVHEYMTIGFTPKDGPFGSAFYSLTGLHGAHVAIGLLLLLFCIIRSIRGHFSPQAHSGLLIASIYWHFVDIVWVVLFAVVYLLPTHVG